MIEINPASREVTDPNQVQSVLNKDDELVRSGAQHVAVKDTDGKIRSELRVTDEQVKIAEGEMNIDIFRKEIGKKGISLKDAYWYFQKVQMLV